MKKILTLFMLVTVFALIGCGGETQQNATDKQANAPSEPLELHVAAAASLTDVMKELADIYTKNHSDVSITFNFGSSGGLQQAIENGGETDLFYSAGKKQMDALDKAGLLADGTNRDLLINEIVLIVPEKDGKDLSDFSDIAREDITKIAVGDEGVPVGQYTTEILANLNLLDAIKEKEVLGTDVRQVLSWVGTGEADCGIVYATDAAISKDVKVICTAPANSHQPVIYPAAALKDSKNLAAAKEFLAFTSSKEAKEIFKKYGFTVKE